jgi:hypothetical protein
MLRVYDMWQLEELEATAISMLHPLFEDGTFATKLRIAYSHSFEDWKYPAIELLVLLDSP